MASTETNQKNITIQINVCSSYPAFNELSEIKNNSIIGKMSSNLEIFRDDVENTTDKERKNINVDEEDNKLIDNVVNNIT